MDNMIKVYIVDDEAITRNGIKEYINWEFLNANVVGLGKNGREVLEYLEESEIDLLITDIRMPEIDGLELIDRITKLKKKIRVIIITAHSEFSYAHKAIKYECVDDFILKPINSQELSLSIESSIKKINEAKFKAGFSKLNKDLMKEYQKSFYQDKLRDLPDNPNKINRDEVNKILQEVKKEVLDENLGIELFKRFSIDILWKINFSVTTHDPDAYESGITRDDIAEKVFNMKNIDEIINAIIEYICLVEEYMNKNVKSSLSSLVATALEMTDRGFDSDVFNLQYVANALNVSANYLSSRFKIETGIGFVRYLNNLRIEKSKELLKDRKYKIYEVCTLAGINDVKYFTRLFKEYTGVTPNEYRESLF